MRIRSFVPAKQTKRSQNGAGNFAELCLAFRGMMERGDLIRALHFSGRQDIGHDAGLNPGLPDRSENEQFGTVSAECCSKSGS